MQLKVMLRFPCIREGGGQMKFNKPLAFSFLMLSFVVGGTVGFTQIKAGGNAEALDPMPRELEVRWALSAIPPYLRSDATVYLLDPANGYLLAHQGTNGFNCFVGRTDYVREDYRKDLIYPLCFDPEG
jgi:hypothetical protein